MTTIEAMALEAEERAAGVTRREFLKVLGASYAALCAAGCRPRPPKDKIVPLSEAPEGYVPGLARWYATTCAACSAGCGVLAKSRDGRPIKLEGNPEHPLSRGGLCARGQAAVLDLYDSERLRGPSAQGRPAPWATADDAVRAGLEACRRAGKAVRVLSRTLVSPSARAALEVFLKAHPGAGHVVYDPLSSGAVLEAHRLTHGRRVLPHYRFDAAQAIVSFDSDFLGLWVSPVEFARDWASKRLPAEGWERMSWHAQFEPRLSLTGAKADLRVPLRPSEELAAVVALGQRVARRVSWPGALPASAGATAADSVTLGACAEMLAGSPKRALVVSGSSDVSVQVAVNWINEMLGAYGSTLDISRPSLQRQGDDSALDALVAEMERGEVGALFIWDANPAYEHPRGADFAKAMGKVPLSVALSERKDETAALAGWVCPVPHFLESWGDAEPVSGTLSLTQPLLAPLFDPRSALESLLAWSGKEEDAYSFLRERWRREVYPHRTAKAQTFESFWHDVVRTGVVVVPVSGAPASRFNPGSLGTLKPARRAAGPGEFELAAYPSVAMGDGRQANNAWLQELPDPISRVSWGNHASFSPADAERLGIVEGRVVRLRAGGRQIELPAQVQPGLAEGVIAAALGYGRPGAGKIAANEPMVKLLPVERDLLAGADLYPFMRSGAVSVEATGQMSQLAKMQRYDFQVDPYLGNPRDSAREMSIQDYYKEAPGGQPREGVSLWPRHEYAGHKWAMAIDLGSCTGCAGCVIACQAENNVPVVGKAEVRKSRDMAWLRIDRYYAGAPEPAPANPAVSFQPMLCQHCDNAPCETVCPVLATVHSEEGLNQQVYNRCVGTRYCANNCPYKVRRFNWFDYAHQDLVQNLALNPDVAVRSRGVMEKCSLCVQRITAARIDARAGGNRLADGAVKTACQQSCPAQAIVFGDINDPESRIAKLARDPRGYRLLGELGVGPSVFYQAKVTNKQV